MKKITYIFSLALLLVTSSCSDFLNEQPELYFVDSDIYSTQERMDGAVLGVYSEMKENYIGAKAFVCIENIGDDMINVSGNGIEALYSYEMSVGMDTQDNYETWEGAYKAINSANTILEGVNSHKEVAGDKYDQYVAELKFCRALCYYYLNMLYAQPYCLDTDALSVPLRLQAEHSLDGNNMARSTVKEVYEQILKDTEGFAALPTEGITRATQGAAHMLRMRVYMAMGNWPAAIQEGKDVKGYALCPDPSEPFKSLAECSESIFSFPMSTTDNGGGMQSSVPYFYYNGNSLVVDITSGIHSELYPAYNLEADKRISELLGQVNGQTISLKFTDGKNYLDWVPIFRYSETLLNLAECYIMDENEVEARKCLKEVRYRSLLESEDILNIDGLSGDDLKNAIYLERRAEFIGEAIRSCDIHRRGENFIKRKNTSSEFTVTPSTNGYVWPIPTVERANNHLIED